MRILRIRIRFRIRIPNTAGNKKKITTKKAVQKALRLISLVSLLKKSSWPYLLASVPDPDPTGADRNSLASLIRPDP
jgi:hypothetical protein